LEGLTPKEPQVDELVRRTEELQPWRRVFHFVGGLCVAWLVYALEPQSPAARWIFGSLLSVVVLVELFRFRVEAANRIVFRVFRVLLRPREASWPTISWYMLGVFIVLWIPDAAVVVPALLVLAVADPVAGVVGQRWGTRRVGKGTVEGSSAFFVAALVLLVPFVGIVPGLLVAALATVAEGVRTPLDDNLVIPVVTAVGVWVV